MRKIVLLVALVSIATISYSQDLSGLWKGNRDNSLLYVVKHNDMYIGYTYDEGGGFCECNFVGSFDTVTQKLKGTNEGFIRKGGSHVQCSYNLRYQIVGGREQLVGSLAPKSAGLRILNFGISTPITYRKEKNTTALVTPFMNEYVATHPVQPGVIEPEITVATRVEPDATTTPVIQTVKIDTVITVDETAAIIDTKKARRDDTLSVIKIKSSTITMQLIDNGVVDGDTVSILHNGKVIAERVAVTAKAYSIDINIADEREVQEIVLVAHNLGSIPPNTALVLIRAGDQQFKLNASADLQHNAVLIFRKE